jgi:heptaprenylglyceryl phosphate synthase
VNYPQYQVVPYTFSYGGSNSSGFLLLGLASVNAQWQPVKNILQLLGTNGQPLALQASQNLAAYPMAYVVGAPWANTAAAEAAAQADYNTITTARDTVAAQNALTATLPNSYVTLGAPVSGPG